jgi:glucosamine-6-phosphate deaminase
VNDFRFDPAPFLEFTDDVALKHVRAVDREGFVRHDNPDFRISVHDSRQSLYAAFADDIVGTILEGLSEGRKPVLIVPAGPMPQYHAAARIINKQRISLKDVTFFAMDEWANELGESAPGSWEGSFQFALRSQFFARIDSELLPLDHQLNFPSSATIADYGKRIADLGGADVCFGGIGWSGHIAFWEPQLGREFAGDLTAYQAASSRLVDLHPLTVAQNALTSFAGDWSNVPPRAVTIGPAEILGARRRSFWLDGDLGGGVTWQGFIARLVAHGPVNEFVPGSLLQTARSDLAVLEAIAAPLDILIN